MDQTHQLDLVRSEVRALLQQSDAFQALPEDQRTGLANAMVRVGSFLAEDPGWLDKTPVEAPAAALAEVEGPLHQLRESLRERLPAGALAEGDEENLNPETGPRRAAPTRVDPGPGLVQDDFRAGATREGVDAFRRLVDTVDFPQFVSGLIQGVFQAIVDASIQQMEAYGELLAATAKSVGEFAQDHITDDQARQQLLMRHPGVLSVRDGRLSVNSDVDDTSVLDQYSPSGQPVDLDDPEGEQAMLGSVRLQMAQQRQRLMALMVLLGINRIIVTNGRINAKVLFEVEATDQARRDYDWEQKQSSEIEAGTAAAAWAPWGAGGAYARTKHRTSVKTNITEGSESQVEMKARLSGEVRVNFRSETLPPEQMIDALQMQNLQAMTGTGTAPANAQQSAGGSQ